jgi:hypothetical protein
MFYLAEEAGFEPEKRRLTATEFLKLQSFQLHLTPINDKINTTQKWIILFILQIIGIPQ